MNPIPSSLQHLAETWNLELRSEADLERVASDDYPCTYALDESGRLIGLNLAGTIIDKLQLDAAFLDLKVLNLGHTQLRTLHLPEGLHDLQSLHLYECEALSELTFGGALPRLFYADLSRCGLTKLELCAELPELQHLYLQKNQLQSIHFGVGCPKLELLDLSENQLTAFTLPAGFDDLQYLYLNNNQLSSLHCAELPRLEILHLRNNELRVIPIYFLEPFPLVKTLYLSNNRLHPFLQEHLNENDIKDSPAFLRQYFEGLKQGAKTDNECKVLLIGDGRAGKSSIVERLVRNQFIENNPSTNGIIIESHPLDPYLLQLWDFAGQDIYHATHRLFMKSGVVYILAWSKETQTTKSIQLKEGDEMRDYDNHGVKYWFNYAKTLGANSPIIVVQTQTVKDKKYTDKETSELEEDNPEIQILRVDSEPNDPQKNHFKRLLTELELAVGQVATIADIPEAAYNLRKALRERQAEKQISYKEYLELAKKFNLLTDPDDCLRNWLVKTGVVYHQKGLFDNQIILDQQWAIDAVYKVFKRNDKNGNGFYHQFLAQEGRVSGTDLMKVWPNNDEQELFLSFMISCEMCFEVTAEEKQNTPFADRKFIIPQLLPINPHPTIASIWKRQKDSLYLRFRHRFLHYGVIQSFIVKTQKLVDDVEGRIWRNGILLEEEEQMVQVEADTQAYEIKVRITPQSLPLLNKVRNLLKKLQDSLGEESVSADGENFVSLKKLEQRKHKTEIEADEGKGDVLVAPLLLFLQRDEKMVFEQQIGEETSRKSHTLEPEKTSKPQIEMPTIKDLIAQAKTEEALNQLLLVAPTQDLKNRVIKLKNDNTEFKRDKMLGILDSNEERIRNSRIVVAALALCDDIEKASAEAAQMAATTPESVLIKNDPTAQRDILEVPEVWPVIPVEPFTGTLVVPKGADDKIKVLFMFATPKNLSSLDVNRESNNVKTEAFGKDLLIDIYPHVDKDGMIDAVSHLQPDIIHYSGHGRTGGLEFIDPVSGNAATIQTSYLAEMFEVFAEIGVKCVVLNSCWSAEQAKAISAYKIAVVGMLRPIKDEAAIKFSKDFYGLLVSNNPLERIFKLVRLKMDRDSKDIPSLWYEGKRIA